MMALRKLFKVGIQLILFLIIIMSATSASLADYTGRYCELEGARTSSGERVRGECYIY